MRKTRSVPTAVEHDPLVTAFMNQRSRLIEVATRIVGCPRRAEDIVHDSYLKLRDVPASAAVREPAHYLARMVRNLAIDWVRKQALEARHSRSEDEGEHIRAPCACPETHCLQHETLCSLQCALDELPARTRQAFLLHRLDGLTQKEVAARLGVSPTLVNFMVRDAHIHCSTVLSGHVPAGLRTRN